MPEQQGKYTPLLNDLKKILPVWGVIISVFILGVLLLKHFNNAIVNYIQYPPRKPALLATALTEEGIKYYQRCLEKRQKMKETGKIRSLKDDPDLIRSRELFLKSLEIFPENYKVYPRLATLAELANDTVSTYYYQGLVLIHEGNVEDGLAFLDKALKLNPDDERVLAKKIEVLIDQHQLSQAEAVLMHLLEVNDKNAEAHYLAGKIQTLKRNPDEAIAQLKKALELNPKHLNSAFLLAELYVANKNFDNAIKVLMDIEPYYPNSARIKHRIGKYFFSQKKYEEAYKYFLRAEKLEKHSADLYLDMARACRLLGKERLASIYVKRAIDLNPALKDKIIFSD